MWLLRYEGYNGKGGGREELNYFVLGSLSIQSLPPNQPIIPQKSQAEQQQQPEH